MYVISECVTCVVVTFTLSAFLFAFCVVFLTIKQATESRRVTSRAFQEDGTHFLSPRIGPVERHRTFGR
jgi:hypothetical protein